MRVGKCANIRVVLPVPLSPTTIKVKLAADREAILCRYMVRCKKRYEQT